MKHKSIGKKMKTLKTYQAQRRTLTGWVENWKEDQINIIERLNQATMNDDHGEIMHMIAQLKEMTEKRFTALYNITQMVSDPQRALIDRADDPEPELVADPIPVREPKIHTQNAASLEVDEIVKRYNQGTSIKAIAETGGVSINKVIKILVTEGVYSSDTYDRIKELRLDGKSEIEIAKICALGKSAMDKYTPYRKGVYLSDAPTKNALKIRKSRNKLS